MYKNILCATELIKLDINVVTYGIELAKCHNSKLIILKVFEEFMDKSEMEMLRVKVNSVSDKISNLAKDAKNKMMKIVANMQCEELNIHFELREGAPSKIICEAANNLNVDLIILGTSHKSHISKLIAGTTAAYVIENSKIPVLIIPENE